MGETKPTTISSSVFPGTIPGYTFHNFFDLQELAALRAQLAEKDREIERLTAIIKREMGEDYLSLQALYIQQLGEIRRLNAELDARSRDVAHMIGERDASQAREREAVEELKLCQRILEQAGCHQVGIHNGIYGLIAKVRSSETALAAARKALEDAQTLIESGSPQMALMVILAALLEDSHE